MGWSARSSARAARYGLASGLGRFWPPGWRSSALALLSCGQVMELEDGRHDEPARTRGTTGENPAYVTNARLHHRARLAQRARRREVRAADARPGGSRAAAWQCTPGGSADGRERGVHQCDRAWQPVTA